jgi:hypothetical protein
MVNVDGKKGDLLVTRGVTIFEPCWLGWRCTRADQRSGCCNVVHAGLQVGERAR